MQRVYLIIKEIISSRFISFIVLFAIILSVAATGAFLLVIENSNRYINENFASSIPPNMIKVSPKEMPSLGLFKFALRRPKESVLSEKSLAKIASQSGVEAIYPIQTSQIPMQAVVSIFGLNYRTDLITIGLSYPYISEDIKDKKLKKLWQNWKPGRELPILIPKVIFNAYNNSLADANGLPKITESMAVGQHILVLFGKSSIKAIPGFAVENARVLGFTDKVDRIFNICLVIPLEATKYYNKKFKGGTADKEYLNAFIKVKDHASLLRTSKMIKSMGYIVETEQSLSQKILELKNNINLAGKVLIGIILVLSVIGIAFSTLIATLDRIDYYRILRILGGSKLFISSTIFFKYALIGLIGALLGISMVEYLSEHYLTGIKIPGFTLSLKLTKALKDQLLFFSVLIPVLATLPAHFKLYTKGMSED